MKLAVVTPRYGADVAGGAETAARLLAERLVVRPGWSVEVLTSCARDADTWADHHLPGHRREAGVDVRRFRVASPRAPDFDDLSAPVLAHPSRARPEDEARWLRAQGPVIPELADALRALDADVVAAHPYLYLPTVVATRVAGPRVVLHPAAHDEAPLRLPVFRDVVARAGGLVYWSEPERRLVEERFAVAAHPSIVLGLGVEPGAGDEEAARRALGVGARPFVLCLGRVDEGKGARLLHELFTAYKRRRPGDLALVFAGPVVHPLPDHPDVVVAGAVPEAVKWGALRGAHLLVSPSALESFSLVLLEGWSVGTPALVNARCSVTSDHARRSGGALAFGSYAALEVALDRLVADAGLRARLGRAGREYVRSRYRWDVLIERYATFLTHVRDRAAAPAGR